LSTVLMTDIVGSTEHAASVGDREWRQVLAAHRSLIRRELARHRGPEVGTQGDGFVATFDGPGRAIRCAQAICAAVQAMGLQVRAGLHTIAGLAVHISARVCALAPPGGVLVSNTVKDLVVGSGIAFADHGKHSLKGTPGEWHLFLATE
jgi:class 3 adenylate cyclase